MNLELVKETFMSSFLVAMTGIGLPIALSFILIPLSSVSSLTAFAAGASLGSTSLGTTYAVLSTAGLASTRVGTILATAAMMDDVVGLLMVIIITSIGGEVDAHAVARPFWASIVLLVIVILAAYLATKFLNWCPVKFNETWKLPVSFVATGMAILGMTAAAGFLGTSVLLSAYLTGAFASYVFEGDALKCYEKYHLVANNR